MEIVVKQLQMLHAGITQVGTTKRRNAKTHNAKRHNAKRHNAKWHNASRHNAKRQNASRQNAVTDLGQGNHTIITTSSFPKTSVLINFLRIEERFGKAPFSGRITMRIVGLIVDKDGTLIVLTEESAKSQN